MAENAIQVGNSEYAMKNSHWWKNERIQKDNFAEIVIIATEVSCCKQTEIHGATENSPEELQFWRGLRKHTNSLITV